LFYIFIFNALFPRLILAFDRYWTVDPLEAEIPQRHSPTAPGENTKK